MNTSFYYVYILKSLKTDHYYIGLTDNLARRFLEHERGKSPTTKSQLPLVIVHIEICSSRLEARKLEKFFKSGYGRETIKEIEQVVIVVK